MDYLDFIRQLSPQQRRSLTQKSNLPGCINLACHVGALATTAYLVQARVPAWPLLMLLHGIFGVFLFTLLHETTHRTAFASRKLNELVASACSLLLVLPKEWFRYFHFAHHRYTQDPINDPELATRKPETIWQYLVYVSGLPVWLGHMRTLYINAFDKCSDKFVPNSARRKITTEARTMIAVYLVLAVVSVLAQSSLLLFIWIFPLLMAQPFLRLYLLAEHGRCAFVADVFKNTRTTYTSWLMRRLCWNMPYHAEHHAYPSVPFFRLPELHRIMKIQLTETENGYIRFNTNYVEQLRHERH